MRFDSLATAWLTGLALAPSATQALAFDYSATKVRGVNLGGWLVLEPFITPGIFKAAGDSKVVDEYTYGEKFGSDGAALRLKKHWDTFITEKDIIKIKSYGLNHVRIPLGYWSVKKESWEPYAVGAYPYLKKAVQWSKQHGLKVMIDLHGAPASQSGSDHSGRRGDMNWHKDPNNVRRTREVLKIIIDDFAVNPAFRDTVTSIQPINEPASFVDESVMPVLKQYYYDIYGMIRYPFGNSNELDTLLTLHDGFKAPNTYWQGFMPWNSGARWTHVALDTHPYTIFSEEELRYTYQKRIDVTCQKAELFTKASLWVMAAEWGVATTECAGSHTVCPAAIGSIYDGTKPESNRIGSCTGKTGNAATFSPEMKTFLRQYWETQVNVYERGIGWIMWTWKTQGPDEWSYEKGVEHGWIPRDPTNRRYPDLCKVKLSAAGKMMVLQTRPKSDFWVF